MSIETQAETRSPNPPAIRLEGVHKAYRCGASSTPVLEGIDLAVPRGECVFLVGPSGSGKTTLLSILGCILSADRGHNHILVTWTNPGEAVAVEVWRQVWHNSTPGTSGWILRPPRISTPVSAASTTEAATQSPGWDRAHHARGITPSTGGDTPKAPGSWLARISRSAAIVNPCRTGRDIK